MAVMAPIWWKEGTRRRVPLVRFGSLSGLAHVVTLCHDPSQRRIQVIHLNILVSTIWPVAHHNNNHQCIEGITLQWN